MIQRREGFKTLWSGNIEVIPDGHEMTQEIQNLKQGKDYYFRVYAENCVGISKAIETNVSYKLNPSIS